jgi:hypothetical protein
MQHVVQPGYANTSLTHVFLYNGLKQGYALSPLLFASAPEYGIASTKVKLNRERLKRNETHSSVTDPHADDNLLGENVRVMKKDGHQ